MFCQTCGKLLQLKVTAYGKWMSCGNGHPQPELVQATPALSFKNNSAAVSKGVVEDNNPLAVHSHKCKNCGYELAELIESAPFYTDEDSLIRMKCGRCGKVERLEGKVT